MSAVGRLATASRDRKVQAWPGRDFVDRDKDLHQISTGNHPGGSGNYQLLDVHGAGAQRSDPKAGDPHDFPHGRGPQGDVIRIFNFVRLVRGSARLNT